MNELTTAKQNTDDLPVLTISAYSAYIAYIDRNERTTKAYLNALRSFAAWTIKNGIDRPTREDIISYRHYLETPHQSIRLDQKSGWTYRTDGHGRRITTTCSASTVAQYLRSVCQFFRWTSSAGIYPNVAQDVRAPKVRADIHKKDALEPADVKVILRMLSDAIQSAKTPMQTEQAKRLYAIFLLTVTAGLRTIEISRANIKDMEVRNDRAYIYIFGKGHSEPDQRKPLAKKVYEAVQDYLQSRSDYPTPTSPLFVATGNRSGGRRIASTTISTMIKQALQAAGYNSTRITAHSLRHTTGTTAQAVCGDLYTVQRYMRHVNPSTTEVYLHASTERQEAELANQLCDLFIE